MELYFRSIRVAPADVAFFSRRKKKKENRNHAMVWASMGITSSTRALARSMHSLSVLSESVVPPGLSTEHISFLSL